MGLLTDEEYDALFDEVDANETLTWTAALTANTNVLTRLMESIEKGGFVNGTAD